MDALFIVVAELLVIPLILWGLIVLELTVGVAASVFAVVVGRRTASDAVLYSWRAIRRKLLWSLIFVSSGLLLADLVFFEAIVNIALGSADDREDLDVSVGRAEGSFILGRIELHDLTLSGFRGGNLDPSSQFSVTIDELIIDIDTAELLSAGFAVEELSLDGVRGSFDRLRPGDPKQERDLDEEPAREFSVERIHFGDIAVALRDYTGETMREVAVEVAELDIGPVVSDSVVFDLLYRTRGRGAIAGHEFVLTSVVEGGQPQTTFELRGLPLDSLAEPLEKIAGVRARGGADLVVVNRFLDGPPEDRVELGVDLQVHSLELEAGADASMSTRMMLKMAARKLEKIGDDFPLAFEVTILRSELQGLRSFADSGVVERVADAIAEALRAQLRKAEEVEEAEAAKPAD